MAIRWETYIWDEPRPVESNEIVLKPLVPTGIFPFGKTSGGEYLCFDYRAAPEQPKVVLVTVETTIKPVANSFADFMASLHDGTAPRV